VAKFYYYPGWWEPGPALSFYVNRRAWDALPEPYRQALEVASHEASARMLASYDAKNPPALKRLVEAGVQLLPFPNDIMQAASSTTREIMEAEATDATYRRINDAYQQWRTDSFEWFRTAEHAYAQFAYGNAAAGECAPGEVVL
jgi:TRAP-type mannitol/chloroaromatic compound transport system substrate-binding protein